MKKTLPLSFLLALCGHFLYAQNTFIVADNINRMSSCQDTAVSLFDIVQRVGIKDLDDPNDDYTKYRMKRLNGSIITEDVIPGPIKYSDYQTIYIEKTNTVFNGHNGLVVYFNLIDAPDFLFTSDTLTYTVDKGAKAQITSDFFANLNLWSSGWDNIPLDERIFYQNMAGGPEQTIKSFPGWATLGKGLYKYRIAVAVCGADDLLWDSMYVRVNESLCNTIEVKNYPSVCRRGVLDLTPFIYVNGQPATPAELADIKVWDKSNLLNAADSTLLNASAINFTGLWNRTSRYPRLQVNYQPNVDLGTCPVYSFLASTKVPSKFLSTDLVFIRDNGGVTRNYTVDGTYYGFNNSFAKVKISKLYLDYYNSLAGTTFKYYTDAAFQNEAVGTDLTPGDYYILAQNSACAEDTTTFRIKVQNRDFDITWQSAPNLGKGRYIFSAPAYAGATYKWFAWGGQIVSGAGTNQVTVYYSENVASSVLVTCTIELTAVRTDASNAMGSALYLDTRNVESIEELNDEPVTTDLTDDVQKAVASTVYPNPTEGTFHISGSGVSLLKVYDVIGNLVYSDANYVADTPVNITVKGLYIVQLIQNKKNQTFKVVIK